MEQNWTNEMKSEVKIRVCVQDLQMLVEAEKVDEGGSSVLRRHVHDEVKGRRRSPARTEAIWLTDLV